jgi:hypothetical protein
VGSLVRRFVDVRTVAEIRQWQAAAGFGFTLTPTFQTGTDPAGLSARSMGVSLSIGSRREPRSRST